MFVRLDVSLEVKADKTKCMVMSLSPECRTKS